jgi:hypothetical protein
MTDRKTLLERIERAKQFASAAHNPKDRVKFEQIAAEYQLEIDAAYATPAADRQKDKND